MPTDGEHYVKRGMITDLIAWEYEYLVYSHLQKNLDFPAVCERMLDLPGKPKQLLRLVVRFRDIFRGVVRGHF